MQEVAAEGRGGIDGFGGEGGGGEDEEEVQEVVVEERERWI